MDTPEEADKAISEMSGFELKGRAMTVNQATERPPRDRGGRDGGFRSGGGYQRRDNNRGYQQRGGDRDGGYRSRGGDRDGGYQGGRDGGYQGGRDRGYNNRGGDRYGDDNTPVSFSGSGKCWSFNHKGGKHAKSHASGCTSHSSEYKWEPVIPKCA